MKSHAPLLFTFLASPFLFSSKALAVQSSTCQLHYLKAAVASVQDSDLKAVGITAITRVLLEGGKVIVEGTGLSSKKKKCRYEVTIQTQLDKNAPIGTGCAPFKIFPPTKLGPPCK